MFIILFRILLILAFIFVQNEDWWDYISENYGEICNSTMKSFTEYVKQFNDGMKLLKLKTEGFSFIGK